MKHPVWLWVVLLTAATGACGPVASRVEIVLDESKPERLLRYYFGAYAGPEGTDPFDAGLLSEDGGRFYVYPDLLEARHLGMGVLLRKVASGKSMDFEGMESFLMATWNEARGFPQTLDALREAHPYREESWLRFDVHGPMTTARRRVFVAEEAIRAALAGYAARGERLLYPAGTAIVGEHVLEGRHVETTAMLRRADGFWDFVTYDEAGRLSKRTLALPRSLASPTQCAGCHFGSKQFEPERSFPSHSTPGPDGPRAYYLDDEARDEVVATRFDEHRKRSDTVLGIYITAYVSQLRAKRPRTEEDARLLQQLGL